MLLKPPVGSADSHGTDSKRRKKNKPATVCACTKLSGSKSDLWKMFVLILFTNLMPEGKDVKKYIAQHRA